MNTVQVPQSSSAGLQQKLNLLPRQARYEVFDFIDFLLKKYPADTEPKPKPKAGCMRGSFIWMSGDFNAPLEDFEDYQ